MRPHCVPRSGLIPTLISTLLSTLVFTGGFTGCAAPLATPPAGTGPQATAELTIRYFGDLGPHRRDITTDSDSAQAYFDDGLLFMYAFGTSIAVRSFRVAQRHDPDCASCYWAEAWAEGPYLNSGMGPDAERRASRAIQQAMELRGNAGEVERALIEAFAVRYEAEPTESRRKALDSLYARAIGDVARRFPRDLDVQTLHAEALILLRPRRGSVDLEDPSVKEILPILEGILARDIRHPGACHLYIHLVEASPEPQRAEACADYLGDAIAVSHIRHMPSHIYMNIGRYGDAVRSNQRAWQADQMAAHGGPPGVYPSHNLHMLLFAATMDGQSAIAIQAARDLAREQPTWSWYVPVTLANFGRWPELLELDAEPSEPFHAAMWRYARGLAHLRSGDAESAGRDLDRLRHHREEVPETARFRFHSQQTLLEIPAGILDAELAYATGRGAEAIATLKRAIEVEDDLTYDEPEPWHLPVRRVLGGLLLDMGRAAEAESVFRAALEDQPNSGWSLFGLARALRAQGRSAEAERAREKFEIHWARADVWLRSSRF